MTHRSAEIMNHAQQVLREQLNKDKMSEDLLGHIPDEGLLKDLHNCCNPNCLVINEVIRRYRSKKSELEKSDDLVTEWQEKYENKKNECQNLDKRLSDAQWTISAQRVDFSQDSW